MKLKLFILLTFFSITLFSQNQSTSDTTVYIVVDQMPEYPGGNTELMKYLTNNISYTSGDVSCNFSKTIAEFIIDENGNVTKPHIKLVEIGGCPKTEEITKNIEMKFLEMPKWKAGMLNGKKVKVKFRFPIFTCSR